MIETAATIPLGKKTKFQFEYAPDVLCAIPRQQQRTQLALTETLPFFGNDIWNAYELTWLNLTGKPVVAMGQFIVPCTSPNIIESKSLKLYLNSLTNTQFDTIETVTETIAEDLTALVGQAVSVKLWPLAQAENFLSKLKGDCLDDLEISCDTYSVNPNFLKTNDGEIVSETLYSNLLKSNCLITGQPDWASIQIEYRGQAIDHAGLLKYIISYRDHQEFHEHCVERIFMDIAKRCQPEQLSVHAYYTRRGGIDINPYRSSEKGAAPKHIRLCRQ